MRMTVLTLCLLGILLYASPAGLSGVRSRIEMVKRETLAEICPPSNGSMICHFIVVLID